MPNSYTLELRRKLLLAHFEERYEEDLKLARERSSFVKVTDDIIAGKRGAMTATVTLTTTFNGELSNARALYVYRLGSPSGQPKGWHCYNDWKD
jgi:hypothetical protein